MMLKPWTKSLLTAFLSLLITAPQMAGQSDGNPSQRYGRQPQRFESQSPSSSSQTISGTIDSIRQINVRSRSGARGQHMLVQVRLNNGRSATVDLGPLQNLRQISLQRGDFIRIRGQQRNVSGRPVFVAQQVHTGNQTVNIQQQQRRSQLGGFAQQRPGQTQQRSSSQRQPRPADQMRPSSRTSQQSQTLRGTIEGFRQVNLRNTMGQRDQHSLVKLVTQNGRSVVVNLGPKQNLDQLDLSKGDQIQVRGNRGTIDGRQVFIATQVRAGGETVQIQRASSQQQAQNFTIEGIVTGYQVLTIGTGDQKQALMNLRLRDGRNVLIDTGKQWNAGELDLANLNLNDRVKIDVQRKNVQGRQMFIANSVDFQDTQATGGTSSSSQSQRQRGSSREQGATSSEQSDQNRE